MEVVVLTQAHCAFCEDAKQLLDRLAGEYGLEVREIDLSSPQGAELARTHAILFPPGILVDGEAVSSGRPSERRLRRELERRAARR